MRKGLKKIKRETEKCDMDHKRQREKERGIKRDKERIIKKHNGIYIDKTEKIPPNNLHLVHLADSNLRDFEIGDA